MSLRPTQLFLAALVVASFGIASPAFAAAISLTGNSWTEDFDTYAGTTETIPAGWVTEGDLVYHNGSPNDGNAQNGIFTAGSSLYNTASGWYAMNSASDPTDIAFGLRTQTSSTSSLTAEFLNMTGGTLSGFSIDWSFEQYSEGYGNGQISLLWSIDGVNFSSVGWSGETAQAGVYGASPPVVYTVSADTDLSASLQYSLADGESLFVRFFWKSSKSGNQPHIAIDDFHLTAVPELSSLWLLSIAGAASFGFVARRRFAARRQE